MRSCRNLLSLFLSLSLFVVALAQPFSTPHSASAAQESKARVAVTAPAGDLSLQLAAIEKTIEQSRKDLGIPGLSLAIVKDDKVIYLKGLGFKDFEHSLPVTPDTLFAIGSSTKAFTAMTAMMRPYSASVWPSSSLILDSTPCRATRTRRASSFSISFFPPLSELCPRRGRPGPDFATPRAFARDGARPSSAGTSVTIRLLPPAAPGPDGVWVHAVI